MLKNRKLCTYLIDSQRSIINHKNTANGILLKPTTVRSMFLSARPTLFGFKRSEGRNWQHQQ